MANLTAATAQHAADSHPLRRPPPPRADPFVFRRVLGHFPTGVVVVTALHEDTPVGFAVGSFASVSLDPPMVGFFPAKASTTWPRIQQAGAFVVNVLGDHQREICQAFATSGGDKFRAVPWHRAGNGAPVIHGASAWIECDIGTVTEAGDHWFVLGRVRDLAVGNDCGPLLFFQGRYASLAGRPGHEGRPGGETGGTPGP
ncbi:flavin reductase family protein [Streptomyces ziwulingensis]|uniref:Flavin reductase like domain-containing protein n=1 Tax=Streptomyces ziwulingensis TaxID=1045501 RepID=A0ABP9AUL2_9ACTN